MVPFLTQLTLPWEGSQIMIQLQMGHTVEFGVITSQIDNIRESFLDEVDPCLTAEDRFTRTKTILLQQTALFLKFCLVCFSSFPKCVFVFNPLLSF